MSARDPQCKVGRTSDGPCDGPVAFEVVARSAGDRRELFREPGCLKHAVAEADRAHAAGSIARVDVEPMAKREAE